MEDLEPRDGDGGEELEAEIFGLNRPMGADRHGVTPEEALEGDTIDLEVERERTDGGSGDETLDLVDDGLEDDEAELAGDAVTERDPFAPPEEAALTVRDDVPGASDHDDPHGDVGSPDDA